ncbi:hypothetical protein [Marasmitruncus massiliensis]|jgi:hypothetical protein|uniref:hypothetical protein n=1 Tax=Marasmitruncus massiliensis TaxID=1944642 RepID=UPI000C7BE897|nr:hypothetical protein [Marasmitruncus massiliensis]
MKRTIALCGTDESTAHELACCGRYLVLNFIEEPERRGDVKLAYFLRDGPLVSLAVVGYPGAEGLSACDYLRSQSGLPHISFSPVSMDWPLPVRIDKIGKQ